MALRAGSKLGLFEIVDPVGAGGMGEVYAARDTRLGRDVAIKVETPDNELNAEISPDGRWLAYKSNRSGRDEIYVRPFPDVDEGLWQVSTDGGEQPLGTRRGGAVLPAADRPAHGRASAARTQLLVGHSHPAPRRAVPARRSRQGL